MAAMSSEGKSFGNLQCLKLHLSPKLQLSAVSRKFAQYFCDKPGGKNSFFPVALTIEPASAGLAFPFERPPPLVAVFRWFAGGLVLVFNLLLAPEPPDPPVPG